MFGILLLLGALGLASSSNPTMGKCRTDIEAVENFKYKEYAEANKGVWEYIYVPGNEVFQNVHKMFVEETVTNEKDVYRSIVYEKKGKESPTVFSDQVRMDEENIAGHIAGLSVTAHNQYKYTVMAYEPGKYLYLYLCSPVGTDDTTDYRFVLATGELSSTTKEYIYSLEGKYHFKKTLRELL